MKECGWRRFLSSSSLFVVKDRNLLSYLGDVSIVWMRDAHSDFPQKKLEKKEGKGGEKERSKKEKKRPRREKDIAKLSFSRPFTPQKSEEEFAAAFFLPLFSQTFLFPFSIPHFCYGGEEEVRHLPKFLCKKVNLFTF